MARRSFRRGWWAVQRERLRIEDPEPAPPFREAVSLGDVLRGMAGRIAALEGTPVAQLAQEWKQIVGEAVAAHSRPGRLQNGRLDVFVDSSVWLSELSRHGKAEVLRNLRDRLPHAGVRDVLFRLDPDSRG
jgi:predicted nucleic acid-binding Zn ribbon protein